MDFSRIYGICTFILIIAAVFIASYSSESPTRVIFNNNELLGSELYTDCTEISLNCEITAYCPGKCCNSRIIKRNGRTRVIDWSDRVAVGGMSIEELHRSGIDIAAVDPRIIPYGSIIFYNDKYYMALDTGGAIKKKRIDLSMKSHESTEVFGRKEDQQVRVYMPRDPGRVVRYLKDLYSERMIK